jgi:hypothetical protein
MLLETIGYQATAPSTGAAGAAFTGDSLTVKNFPEGKAATLLAAWVNQQTAGYHQLIWPSAHDTARNLRIAAPSANRTPAIPVGLKLPLQAQELIAVTIVGSATAGDIEQGFLTLFYEEVPGLEARLIDAAEFEQRGRQLLSVQATVTTGTAGGWSGAELITSESDLLRANRDYALLGATNHTAVGAIGIKAPDWGNVRVGVPGGAAENDWQRDWFWRLAFETGLPTIPVLNSANKGNIWIDAAVDENGADPVVSLMLCLLD